MIKKNIQTFFNLLSKKNPKTKSDLKYTNNFTLLIAVVLSAQSTDIGVNKATKKLFLIIIRILLIMNILKMIFKESQTTKS